MKKCDVCDEELACCWVSRKNVCSKCFDRLKSNNNKFDEKGKIRRLTWMDKIIEK